MKVTGIWFDQWQFCHHPWHFSCRVEENQQRRKVQELEAHGDLQKAAALKRHLDTPPDAQLQSNITSLAVELDRCYGSTKRMPTRAQIRADNRQVSAAAHVCCNDNPHLVNATAASRECPLERRSEQTTGKLLRLLISAAITILILSMPQYDPLLLLSQTSFKLCCIICRANDRLLHQNCTACKR